MSIRKREFKLVLINDSYIDIINRITSIISFGYHLPQNMSMITLANLFQSKLQDCSLND